MSKSYEECINYCTKVHLSEETWKAKPSTLCLSHRSSITHLLFYACCQVPYSSPPLLPYSKWWASPNCPILWLQMNQLTVLFIRRGAVIRSVNLVLLLHTCLSSSCEHTISMCFSVSTLSLQSHFDDSKPGTFLQHKYCLRLIMSVLIWMSTELSVFASPWCILSLALSGGALTVTLHLALSTPFHCTLHSLSTVFLPVLSFLVLLSVHSTFSSITSALVGAGPFIPLLLCQAHFLIVKHCALMNSLTGVWNTCHTCAALCSFIIKSISGMYTSAFNFLIEVALKALFTVLKHFSEQVWLF